MKTFLKVLKRRGFFKKKLRTVITRMNGSQSLYGNQVRPIFPPYKGQSINSYCKLIGWFLYGHYDEKINLKWVRIGHR